MGMAPVTRVRLEPLIPAWDRKEARRRGEKGIEKRLAIAQQVEVGGFVSKIDSDGAVASRRFGGGAHGSPSVIRACTLMGHDGGNAL